MRKILSISFFLFSCGALVLGQTAAGVGAISGVVTDPSGATIEGAEVVVSNESLGIHRTLTTTGGGIFAAPSLVPNSGYQVSIRAQGFAPF